MSIPTPGERKRSIVPRWRSMLNTPTIETITTPRFADYPGITSQQFSSLVQEWRKQGRAEDAVDIMDAGIASGNRALAVEGAKRVLSFSASLKPRVVNRANVIIYGSKDYSDVSKLPENEYDEEQIYKKISNIKKQIYDNPRNTLAHVEVARLYSRIAQFDKAEKNLLIAVSIDPNDRFVLRACARFFTMIHNEREALKILWASESIRYDPWIQSAELAVADLAGKSTKFSHNAAKRVLNRGIILRNESELATGWVSREIAPKHQTRELVKRLHRTLTDPTENALAQGVWLLDASGVQFRESFPDVKFGDDAYEATALSLIEAENFEEAEKAAQKWYMDQPFQVRAAIELANTNFTYLHNWVKSFQVSKEALKIHNGNWILVNLACISSVYNNDFEEYSKYLKIFENIQNGFEQEAFLLAARGVGDIRRGRYYDGVQNYLKACEVAKKNKRQDLLINAIIFLIEQLSCAKLIGNRLYKSIELNIQSSINKLDRKYYMHSNRTWKFRKKYFEKYIDFDESEDVLKYIDSSEIEKLIIGI